MKASLSIEDLVKGDVGVHLSKMQWLQFTASQFRALEAAADTGSDICGRLIISFQNATGDPWTDAAAFVRAGLGLTSKTPIKIPKEALITTARR